MTLEILTPKSPRWRAFTEAVYSWIVISEDPLEWRCEGPDDARWHRAALAVMAQMGGVDVMGTIAFLDAHCLSCDCAVAEAFLEGVRS